MLSPGNTEILLLNEVRKGTGTIRHTPDKPDYVIVYDLYHTALALPHIDFESYRYIFDIYILERLAHLGVNHNKYLGKSLEPQSPFLRIIEQARDPLGTSSTLPESSVQEIVSYTSSISRELLNKNGWQHYLKIEIPFALSLSILTRSGCAFDREKASHIFEQAPITRNIIAQQIIDYGIEETNNRGLVKWCESHSAPEINQIAKHADKGRIDYKKYISRHPVFELYKVLDKLTRAHQSISKVEDNNLLYPQYMTVGTETCRCTSRSPNVMGIPKELRPLIIPRAPDRGIVEIDYCQMEVGVVAALANDSSLIADFNSGDVYTQLAQAIGMDRDSAKQMFLAILYGVGERTLSSWLGLSMPSEIESIIRNFFTRYPQLEGYLRGLEYHGARNGFAVSITGLRRSANRTVSRNPSQRIRNWENNWFKNFPVQCSSAAVFKTAIIKINKHVNPDEYNIIAPMYDAIVFEGPLPRLEEYITLTSRCMKEAMMEYFPQLNPQVDINKADVSCWNSTKAKQNFNQFLQAPLQGISLEPEKKQGWFSL